MRTRAEEGVAPLRQLSVPRCPLTGAAPPDSGTLGGMRKLLALVLAALALAAVVSPGRAAEDQIADAAGDNPVPFLDLTGVGLAVTSVKGTQYLQTKFILSGPVSPESRVLMTGYSFTSKVAKCELLVRFVALPDGGVFTAPGAVATRCGADGRDVSGTFRIVDNTITVLSPLRDLKEVTLGQTMTDLRAFTSPGEEIYHDETTAPSALGDTATSDKSWLIG